MSWITGLITLIKAVPDFLKLAKEIMGFLHEVADYFERHKKLKELKDALEKARKEKDTRGLDELFGGSKPPPPAA